MAELYLQAMISSSLAFSCMVYMLYSWWSCVDHRHDASGSHGAPVYPRQLMPQEPNYSNAEMLGIELQI